jgi:predicted HAD superfamily phosphohydrolase YqeG
MKTKAGIKTIKRIKTLMKKRLVRVSNLKKRKISSVVYQFRVQRYLRYKKPFFTF